MGDTTTGGERPMPARVKRQIVVSAKKGRKAAGQAPKAGLAMDTAMMRVTTGILAARMIEDNAPHHEPAQ